jgi:hypothetical protein
VQIDIGSILLAVGTIIAALGIPTFVASRRSKTAVAKMDVTNAKVDVVVEAVRPENGDIRLAEQIETIATDVRSQGRLLEVVDGRVHDVSKRIDAQGREVGEVRRHQSTIEAQLVATGESVDEVRRDLGQHLEEVAPLIAEHHSHDDAP